MPRNVSLEAHNGVMVTKSKNLSSRKKLGAVYTPEPMALWLANHVKQLGYIPKLILDPAAGAGALIAAALKIFPLSDSLAYEIDPIAHKKIEKYWPHSKSILVDALAVSKWIPRQSSDVLIFSNPPWGATIESENDSLYRRDFLTANGFYDTYDLFLEKAIKELPEASWGAFFLPDSVLLNQHQTIRKFLLENTQIKSVTRLPEGVFEGVAMGSIALVFKKVPPRKNSRIRVSRISRNVYRSIKDDYLQISKEIDRNRHFVTQQTWAMDANFGWLMDFRDAPKLVDNLRIFKNVDHGESTWDEWFLSGRGLEIGKKSELLNAVNFGTKKANGRLVAVGEDVNRLSVEPSKSINRNLSEFNYKNELEDVERLLVRKTGIGIKAVVASGIATTQTVYHFTPKEHAPNYALHYASGFLLSRLVIALHLAKTGETEWRSHPYVTQKAIRELNIPIPKPGSSQERLAKRIAEISQRMHEIGSDPLLEEELDSLVCEIIDGTKSLQNWAYNFLSSIKGCSYTKSLVANLSAKSKVA